MRSKAGENFALDNFIYSGIIIIIIIREICEG